MTGRKLSHYQVLEPLGSGGMGEVFKARDTRLNRLVALKILRPERVTQDVRKQRFIQEAQAASALNHPNIVTIHDIDQQDGVDFLVMEHIAGRTLDALIPRGGVRLNEALRIAVQIAEGLRRAHAAGIIHRDLKPSNIMVADDGLVKILDFGLAKLMERGEGTGEEGTQTALPETEEGTVMGTTAYMSPEQAEGRKLDARTDIFSFGVVLYEMLTGQKAFPGETRLAVMSAILKDDPKPVEGLPADLDKLMRRCLRKDREKRFQHMDDLRLALEDIREDSASGKLESAGKPALAARSRWPWIAAASLAVAGLIGAAAWSLRSTPAESVAPTLTRLTSDAGLTTMPAISLDGKLLAYASDRATRGENLDIWLQHLGGGDAVRLTKEDADESEPDFSPDGSHVAYASGRNGIWVVPTLGGEPRQISPKGSRPRYSPDGRWIVYQVVTLAAGELPGEVWIAPAGGGAPRRLVSDFGRAMFPVWSPDGKRVLFEGSRKRGDPFEWFVVPVEGGAAEPAGLRESYRALKTPRPILVAAHWTNNYLVLTANYAASQTSQIMRVRMTASGKVDGAIEPVTSGTSLDEHPSVAADGRLVFAATQFRSHLWMLPVDGTVARITGEMEPLTEGSAVNDTASISHDGTRLLFRSNRDGKFAIWLRDMTTGKLRRLSTDTDIIPAGATFPDLASDGQRASFDAIRAPAGPDNRFQAIVANVEDGTFLPPISRRSWGISPSGRFLLTYDADRSSTGAMEAIRIEDGESAALLSGHKWPQRSPRIAPDERWVTMHVLNTARTRQILIAPFQFGRPAPESDWIFVTDGTTLDRNPAWSPDGNMLYWIADRDGTRGIWAVKLDPATKHPAAPPFEVRMFRSARRNMMRFSNTATVQAAVARDKIVFALGEETGNIWMTRLPD